MDATNDFIPVILVRGFLDSGKSTFINQLFHDDVFSSESVLLLSCEEGETAFDDDVSNRPNVTTVILEQESLLNRDYLEQLASDCSPSQIIIECNTMWKMIEFELPKNWKVEKRIAILCGVTLDLYLDNMRSLLGPMLSRCDQIIINRYEPEDFARLGSVKRKLRPLLDNPANVIIKTSGGCYDYDAISDTVPYSLDQDVIPIAPEHYVFWFYDCRDHPKRYDGKRVILNASVKKSPVLPKGDFALGKIAITCCEADMSFLGYIAHYEEIDSLSQLANVRAEAIIRYRFMKNFNAVMPYLEITQIDTTVSKDSVATF